MSRAMKESGIAWIGEIPEHWKVENIGNQVKEVRNPNLKGEETNALQFKLGAIIPKSQGNSNYTPETLDLYNIVDEGVIMINGLNLSFDFLTQRVALVKEKGVITSTYIAVKPYNTIDSNFLNYLFKSYDTCKAFHGMGRGLRQTLSYNELRKYLLITPPLPEQHLIASFLDQKCAEIDELIALQEKMLDELKRYKQAVITEAVTKGLNPNVPMKDSGIEWIGEVPEHWEVCKIKQIMRNKSIKDYPQEQVLSLYRDYGVIPKNSRDDNHNVTSEDTSTYKFVEVGDFVMNKMKAWQGSMAVSNYRGIISPAYYICGFVTDDIVRKYVHYLLRNNSYKPEYMRLSTGLRIGQWDLNVDDFLEIKMILPPLPEQRAIADYLDQKCTEIDALSAIKQQKIAELKEYKKSIIYEYVTGKKQVKQQ